jgi:hypothetical protein
LEQLIKARDNYHITNITQRDFWQQKSNLKWIDKGEANTAYFHVVVRN